MNFKFKEVDEPVYTSDIYYDFLDGGHINPEELLNDEEQINALLEARALISSFLYEAEEAGVLEIE